MPSSKWIRLLFLLVVGLLAIEGLAQIVWRVATHRWVWQLAPGSPVGMFQPHPYLVGAPIPNSVRRTGDVTITHNSNGWRSPELHNPKSRTRVVVLGDSATYGLGVNDADTYPAQLQKSLGDSYEVINMAVPGYSTVEEVIQTALLFSDLQPDIAIYYIGWTDARNMHVKDLKPDYSDFHGPAQWDNLGEHRGWWTRHFVLARMAASAWNHFWFKVHHVPVYKTWYPNTSLEASSTAYTTQLDQRPLDLYARNVRELILLCRAQQVTPVFVPLRVNRALLTRDVSSGWVPLVKDKDFPALADAYNSVLENTARSAGADFVSEASEGAFDASDFADAGHFTSQGSRKMAAILAARVRSLAAAKTAYVPSTSGVAAPLPN